MGAVLTKSLKGYVIAFVAAMLIWGLVTFLWRRLRSASEDEGPAHPAWRVFQWITTGLLWSVWVMQDAANIAVYLPRSLSGLEFSAFAGAVTLGLGWMFYSGGERIQQIVDEKEKEGDVYQFLEEDDDFEEFEPDAEEAQRIMNVEMAAGGEIEKTLWQ